MLNHIVDKICRCSTFQVVCVPLFGNLISAIWLIVPITNKKGVPIPWQKSWSGGEQAPQNLISRKPYRGVNVFLLNAMHYSSPFWLTFKQAQELGGHVRKGEKSCPVVFWKWLDVTNKDTNEPQRIPLLRYYSVFNVAQCEGISIPTVAQPVREHTPIEAAQKIIGAMPKRPEIKLGLAHAFYSPAGDFVGMPSAEQFKTGEDFYSVLFHELCHSTGHESRLNRKGMSGTEGNWSSFGSNPYAKEELVREMGAAFLCGEAGIVERTINRSAELARLAATQPSQRSKTLELNSWRAASNNLSEATFMDFFS
jgi:antirestriction protein ArdC